MHLPRSRPVKHFIQLDNIGVIRVTLEVVPSAIETENESLGKTWLIVATAVVYVSIK